ncbi:hypothetical protein SAMN05444166_0680 [Singulisphaera sp. GP187]|nr:hypothetical protein SAMN05444166_0680 [Singulisphaera sp. GP187]
MICRVPWVPYSEPMRECLGLARTGSEYGPRGTQTSFISRFTLTFRDRL